VLLYGRGALPPTLREEHRRDYLLTRIWGPKRNETGDWRKLHNEELHNVYSSPNIIRMIKSSRMRWAGHLASKGKRNAYTVLVGKPEGKKPVGRPRRRWGIIQKWILEKEGGVVWTGFIWLRIGHSIRLLSTR
jgi:hypothetical protein